MKTISDIKESIYLLEKYNGSCVQIWGFNISLKRLLLKLTKSNESYVLFIIVVGCEHFTGPFSWKNSCILLSIENDSVTSEQVTKIKDKAAGFELISTGGFALAQGLDSEFDNSFVNFDKG
jgi:hypothetical protein